jgi:hypothetical protein
MATNPPFATDDLVREPVPGIPRLWSALLSSGSRAGALEEILGMVGLKKESAAGKIILGSVDQALLLSKRRRQSLRMMKLLLQLTDRKALFFGYPDPELLACACACPEPYVRLVSELGAFTFAGVGGLLWPATLTEASEHVRQAAQAPATEGPPVPFYDLGTGDYDCWCDPKGLDVWDFNHETGKLTKWCSGGFGNWFQARLRKELGVERAP